MAKLDLALLVGEDSKKFLVALTAQIDRLEELSGKLIPKKKEKDEDETEVVEEDADIDEEIEESGVEASDDEDEDFSPKAKKKSKKAAQVDFDDEEEAEEDEEASEDEDVDDAPAPKAKGKKKITVDDLNDAAKELAHAVGGKPGRAKVLSLMKKHFKTETVSEVKPEQFEKFIAVMKKELEAL